MPDAAELPDRLHGVAATVYLLFTEGYGRADGATAADEALRLARLLHGLMPDEPAVLGLLALLLLQDSRRSDPFHRSRRRRAAGRSGPRAVAPSVDHRGRGARR